LAGEAAHGKSHGKSLTYLKRTFFQDFFVCLCVEMIICNTVMRSLLMLHTTTVECWIWEQICSYCKSLIKLLGYFDTCENYRCEDVQIVIKTLKTQKRNKNKERKNVEKRDPC